MRKIITDAAEHNSPRSGSERGGGGGAETMRKRASVQISGADADEPMSDQWLWVFCPAEPPETPPPGAFITHHNV